MGAGRGSHGDLASLDDGSAAGNQKGEGNEKGGDAHRDGGLRGA